MSYFSKKDYKLLRFEKSKTKGKKYDAILLNKRTGKERKIPFGASSYEHYQDTTGLGLWSNKNHGDKQRRLNYRARHKGFIKPGFYSAGFFSYNYLW